MSELDLIARQIHPGSLYREETFTDRKTATIRVLTPVTEDGAFDGTRSAVYLGDTQLLTNTGVLPLVFDLEARSLADATAKFASAARATVQRTLEKLEDLRRRTAASLIDGDWSMGPILHPTDFSAASRPAFVVAVSPSGRWFSRARRPR